MPSSPADRPLIDEIALREALPGRRVVVTRRTASTNADLAYAARGGTPVGTVHTTNHQDRGRGRLDRSFEMPDGSGVAVSVLVRPGVPLEDWGWLSLVVGLAVRDAVAQAGVDAGPDGGRLELKWPNDVLVGGKKISGILVEAVDAPDGWAAVVGVGVNVALTPRELPVPTATSLLIEGGSTDRTRLVADLVSAVDRRIEQWSSDPGAIRAEYAAVCSTVGRDVRVHLPTGEVLEARATAVDGNGRLVVGGRALAAGDVVHVRPTA